MSFNPLLVRPHFDDDNLQENKKEEEMKLLDKIKERKQKKDNFWKSVNNKVAEGKDFLKLKFTEFKNLPTYQKITAGLLAVGFAFFINGITHSNSILLIIGIVLIGIVFLALFIIIIILAIKLAKKKAENKQ